MACCLQTPAQSSPVPDPGAGLVDLTVFVGIDLSGLGDLLNAILRIVLGILDLNKCEYRGVAGQLEGLVADILVFVDVKILSLEVRASLLVLLGPLLEALSDLIAALLGGLSIKLSIVVNLVLNLLLTLNLHLDVAVALQLGNLLNLDVLALVKLG